MTDLSTILRLVRDQIQKLEELLRVIQNGSRPKLWNKHHRNWSPFEIEVFAHENEQMMDVHVALQWMVEEREKALAQINALNQDLEGILSRVRISDLYLMRLWFAKAESVALPNSERMARPRPGEIHRGRYGEDAEDNGQARSDDIGVHISHYCLFTTWILLLCTYFCNLPPSAFGSADLS